ncbi:hypothetical protein C6Y39_12460 [Alteromonas gracilis]|uniref:Glycosyltransferase family 1 protein n=2 Tax=Alteromonas gracilis TaxID=1479524 RepID=A0ABX5CLK3_9ALTE|nr:hypothetical protein C6Y39_12460 [Alteromonas gracilis]
MIHVDNLKVYIDCSDSPEMHTSEYEECDLYFKRTLRSTDAYSCGKVRPFGLYFEVYPSFYSPFTLKRFLSFSGKGVKNKCKSVLKALDTDNRLGFLPREDCFNKVNNDCEKNSTFKVLFYVRLWNPNGDKEFVLSESEKRDREVINTSRLEIIRLLKAKFGENALVGVMNDPFARKVAPELIVDESFTSKKQYLKQVQESSVCIATTGLHSSIGAKFAEYVSLGKAIVSESFNYCLPGEIEESTNYLEFNSPEKCIRQVERLYESPDELLKMKEANLRYAKEYLQCNKIVSRLIGEVNAN